MRISDLSTFDSKPILWSQLDELLRNKNVTMLGNQANIPSGLVVLDDKGKIPEDADIQHIFYVDNEFPTSGLVKNSLYVSSAGEARATNDNAEYINISLQVVTDFSTVSDDTIATTKAIKDYIDTAVTEGATGTSGVLSSYATKEYVDNAVASASGEQHIFYVDALPSIEDAIEKLLIQCSPLFIQQTENLTSYQMNFLRAVCSGITDGFGKQSVSEEFGLGSKSNISRLIKSLTNKELIDRDKNGIIIKENDVYSYASQLESLMLNEVKRKCMASFAIEYSKRLAPNIIGEKWYDLFNDI